MMAKRIAAVSGALAVAMGAFGAHGLEQLAVGDGRIATWETAARYHLIHSVLMLFLAVALPKAKVPFALIAGGTLVFSGTLYALVLADMPKLGAITPVGGALLIAGWLSLLGVKDS